MYVLFIMRKDEFDRHQGNNCDCECDCECDCSTANIIIAILLLVFYGAPIIATLCIGIISFNKCQSDIFLWLQIGTLLIGAGHLFVILTILLLRFIRTNSRCIIALAIFIVLIFLSSLAAAFVILFYSKPYNNGFGHSVDQYQVYQCNDCEQNSFYNYTYFCYSNLECNDKANKTLNNMNEAANEVFQWYGRTPVPSPPSDINPVDPDGGPCIVMLNQAEQQSVQKYGMVDTSQTQGVRNALQCKTQIDTVSYPNWKQYANYLQYIETQYNCAGVYSEFPYKVFSNYNPAYVLRNPSRCYQHIMDDLYQCVNPIYAISVMWVVIVIIMMVLFCWACCKS